MAVFERVKEHLQLESPEMPSVLRPGYRPGWDKQVADLIASLPPHIRENCSEEALESFADLFAEIDKDVSHSISVKELKQCFKSLEIKIRKDELRALFLKLGTTIDDDGVQIRFPGNNSSSNKLYLTAFVQIFLPIRSSSSLF